MSKQRWIIALLLLVMLPAAADAQRRTRGDRYEREDRTYWNRFSLEPYAGAFRDAYDISDANTGYLVGLRVGYDVGWRGRVQLNAGYSKVDDVALFVPTSGEVYDNNWIFTTVGGEFDVIPGRTSASLGLHGGVAWRKTTIDQPLNPVPGDEGYAAYEVLAPGLTVRHRLSPRAAIGLTVEDYIFDLFEGRVDHSPAISLGFSFR